jgi:hypothetical protein
MFLAAFTCVAVVVAPVAAQENPFSINGSPQKHGGEPVTDIDQVDPLSGNLVLDHTDLDPPGDAGRRSGSPDPYPSSSHPTSSRDDERQGGA